jgi:hypothetical protein
MRILFFLFSGFIGFAQNTDSLIQNSNSLLKKLKSGDSLVYYQCHVEALTQQLTTASGQTLTGNSNNCSITEKLVVKKVGNTYLVNHYSSPLTICPNRKFSGLKVKERGYWEFKFEKEFTLNERGIRTLLAIEKIGKEANEYDFVISKYNQNQVIILGQTKFKQLGIEGNYVLSKLLHEK